MKKTNVPEFPTDASYLRQTLALAERGLYTADPNPRVGCVLVNHGHIVGEGWHERVGGAHAEVIALKQAGDAAKGSVCYVNLEPCCHQGHTPPCTDALIKAGVSKVIACMQDPNPKVAGQGFAQLRQAGIAVEMGLLAEEAEQLNAGFVKRMRHGLPYVRVKLAMSLDGRTALKNGQSQWLTGELARQDVHQWRARSSAVMTGIETVLHDDPLLTARIEPALSRQPIRVVMDSQQRMPANARLWQVDSMVWLMHAEPKREAFEKPQAKRFWLLAGEDGFVDLKSALRLLAEQQINEVWLEAGPTLSGAMLQQGLMDELILYVAPKILGADAKPLFELYGIHDLDQAMSLRLQEAVTLGEDVRLRFKHL